MTQLPSIEDVRAAAVRISGVAHRTQVLTSRYVDELLGASVFFKAENFQRMGAFKFRGAYNALAQFDTDQRRRGVLTFSSGNHAQAIALSAHELGIPATIIMPADAPPAKMIATMGYGGNVVTYDRYNEDREVIGKELADRHGFTIIPPFDHPDVIAGQGTAALELLEEVGDLDLFLSPLGGGGLLSGSALSLRARSSKSKIIGVEPEAGNDGQQSFHSGSIVRIDVPRTIADGAQTQALGTLTFAIIQRDVDDIVTATDEELRSAQRLFAERLKVVVEPTGALGLAAAHTLARDYQGKRIGIVISGGNVDMNQYGRTLASLADS
ncbi:MAG: threo-3-hydroxy-L-aspartate ammonia-lyase [Thermomicrobiales bacterium]